MKVLLTTLNSKYIHQNLAIRILYEINRDYDNLSWKEFNNKDSKEFIAKYCSGFQVVAFSCYIWNIQPILEIAANIKNLNPKSEILLGGPEISYDWEDIAHMDQVDFIIPGEGEIPFSSFLKFYPDFEKVPGLIWKNKNTVMVNQMAGNFDLNQLMGINPYIHDNEVDLKNRISYIESSRGCPYTCTFCLAGQVKKLRYLPMETIQSNLLYLIQKGRIIKFLDRTFNSNPAFAISIITFILENYQPGNIFQFEIKADSPQPELVEFIRNKVPKGLFRFEIGIQTINPLSNKEIRRKQDFGNIRDFVSQIADKVEIHLDLIVGLPYDYWEDIRFSFEETFNLFAPELQLGFLKFLKGTPIRNNHEQHDYCFNQEVPYQIIKSKYLKPEEIKQLELLENALEIYWNKKRALYTLKYVALNHSIFDFLLGLGNYFHQKVNHRAYDVREVFDILYEFSMNYFSDNQVISEIIALDYYLFHKVKPGIRYLAEIDRETKKMIFNNFRLDHHHYRYIVHPFHFNIRKFVKEMQIEMGEDWLIIPYNGVSKPTIFFVS